MNWIKKKKNKIKTEVEYLWEKKLKKYIPEAKVEGFGDIIIDDKQIGLHMNNREVICYSEEYEENLRKYANDVNALYLTKKYRTGDD